MADAGTCCDITAGPAGRLADWPAERAAAMRSKQEQGFISVPKCLPCDNAALARHSDGLLDRCPSALLAARRRPSAKEVRGEDPSATAADEGGPSAEALRGGSASTPGPAWNAAMGGYSDSRHQEFSPPLAAFHSFAEDFRPTGITMPVAFCRHGRPERECLRKKRPSLRPRSPPRAPKPAASWAAATTPRWSTTAAAEPLRIARKPARDRPDRL